MRPSNLVYGARVS